MLVNCVKITWDIENINGVYIKAAEKWKLFLTQHIQEIMPYILLTQWYYPLMNNDSKYNHSHF